MPTQEIIFRDDDMYLTESPTQGRELYSLEKFKKAHELLVKYGKKHAMAIIAAEINNYPELTKYILSRKDEFIFGVHGWTHNHYATWKQEPIEVSLARAKKKIEETFDVTCEWFFPPWNEQSDALTTACFRVGLKPNYSQTSTTGWIKSERAEAICFHYWSDGQMDELEKILRCYIPQ